MIGFQVSQKCMGMCFWNTVYKDDFHQS